MRILGPTKVTALEIQHQRLSEFDAGGRRRPVPITGAVTSLAVDVVIPAVGQQTDLHCVANAGFEINRNATIKVDKDLGTTRAGVFAAGDVVSGPATVIDAVAHGNRAAYSVHAYLRSTAIAQGYKQPEINLPPLAWDVAQYGETARLEAHFLPVPDRRAGFREVELPQNEADIQQECRRCLRCDLEWAQLHAGPAAPPKTLNPAAAISTRDTRKTL